jgi:hypothetical protein
MILTNLHRTPYKRRENDLIEKYIFSEFYVIINEPI